MTDGDKDQQCVVAVDVGNSAVKLAVCTIMPDAVTPEIVDHSINIGSSGWELSVIGWVRDQVGCEETIWRIASVHRSAATQLEHAINKSYIGSSVHRVSYHDVPMPADVDHPERLGIDRLLSAYAAHNRLQSALVAVDAGSAVTVDWVSDLGVFCGGAILPGLAIQSRALVMGTEALPQVTWESDTELKLPAKNTADAIRAGIIAGVAGSIDGLIDRFAKSANLESQMFPIALTGGDAEVLSRHLRHKHEVLPNLVCRGLLDLPRSKVEFKVK